MNERDHFHNLALRTNNELHWSSYKRLRNVVTLKLRKEKQRYFNEQLRETKGDSRGTWKNLKQLLGRGSKSSGAAARTANEAKEKCNIFNRFFVSRAEDLRSTHRSSARSFSNGCLKLIVHEHLNYERSLYRRFVRLLKN